MSEVPADVKAALERRLSKVKVSLLLEYPFFGNLALGMPHEINYTVPTAATNGKRIIYNPDFCAKLCDKELLFLVAHECGHPMLEHPYRRGKREPWRWNKACDYIVNQLLVEEKIGKLIDGALYDPTLHRQGNGTTENIYDLLPEEPQGGGGGGYGEPGNPLDDCQDAEGTPAEIEQAAAEWKVKVAQAAQAARVAGKLSGGLERFVGSVLQPKVQWEDVMARFFERAKTDARSWARFNRRMLSQGIYLPSIGGEALGEVAFAVDCSGSIDEKQLNQFAAEIRKVKDDLHPVKLHVIYFDSRVSHYECYEGDDTLNIKPHGGGGTAFSPVFRYIEAHGIDPVACVFLTDLCCSDFGPEPGYPVLWVSTDEGKAPFGEVVLMDPRR